MMKIILQSLLANISAIKAVIYPSKSGCKIGILNSHKKCVDMIYVTTRRPLTRHYPITKAVVKEPDRYHGDMTRVHDVTWHLSMFHADLRRKSHSFHVNLIVYRFDTHLICLLRNIFYSADFIWIWRAFYSCCYKSNISFKINGCFKVVTSIFKFEKNGPKPQFLNREKHLLPLISCSLDLLLAY